ncbi:MAG: hypothetical protein HYY18_03100 [Planctomycetes bacterium]|nr:hypothetical protein [Planctomycetota bacterium]
MLSIQSSSASRQPRFLNPAPLRSIAGPGVFLVRCALLLVPGEKVRAEDEPATEVRTADDAFRRLDDPDRDRQDTAVRAIEEGNLPAEELVRLIRRLPELTASKDPSDRRAARALKKMQGVAVPDFLPAVVEIYDRLEGHEHAREEALSVIAKIPGEAASGEFLNLLGRASSRSLDLTWVSYPDDDGWLPRNLPRLLRMAPLLDDRVHLFSIAESHLEAGTFSLAEHPDVESLLIKRIEVLVKLRGDDLAEAYGRRTRRIPDEEELKSIPQRAQRAHEELEYLLDIAGYLKADGVDAALVRGLQLSDNTLRIFAIRSILRRKGPVPAGILEDLAALPSERALLYLVLKKAGSRRLFPGKYLNQSDMAIADMVQWLEYPTELGSTPVRIEPLKIVEFEDEDSGEAKRVYFFKFSDSVEGKWYVGWSAAYTLDEANVEDDGGTFSNFTELAESDLEKHFREYSNDKILRVK